MKGLKIFLGGFFILVFITACELIKDEKVVRRYSVENQSGVPISIRSYNKGEDGTIYDGPKYTNLKNGEELIREERLSANTDYDFSSFFGGAYARHQTLEVVFNKVKKRIYVSESYDPSIDSCKNAFYKMVKCTDRNPLSRNRVITDTDESPFKFVFKPEDYQNAEDCDGECD